MPLSHIEKFDKELRNEIQAMWKDGRLDRIIQIFTKFCARPGFYKHFCVNLNFDLVVHTDGGKKWHLVPLAFVAQGMSSSPALSQAWVKAQKSGTTPKKQLEALRKQMNKSLEFSGVSFGLIPRGKYTGRLRRVS